MLPYSKPYPVLPLMSYAQISNHLYCLFILTYKLQFALTNICFLKNHDKYRLILLFTKGYKNFNKYNLPIIDSVFFYRTMYRFKQNYSMRFSVLYGFRKLIICMCNTLH